MKKIRKLLLLVCVLTIAFSLSACGEKKDETPAFSYNASELMDNLVQNTEYVADMDYNTIDIMIAEYETRAKSNETYNVLLEGLKQLKDAKEDSGDYEGFYLDDNDAPIYKVMTSKESVTIKATAKFSKRDVKVIYIYEPVEGELNISSITYEPTYTKLELMKNAGMNTVIGISVVVLVLAFLSAFISLFRYVNKFERYWVKRSAERREKKEARNKNTDLDHNIALINEKEEQALANEEEVDNTELIAVITAAIAASQTVQSDGFVVRSVRRVSGSKWKRSY